MIRAIHWYTSIFALLFIVECADYTFGKDCVGECHCRNEMEVCDKRTGTCKSGCAPGWTGNTCQTGDDVTASLYSLAISGQNIQRP